MALNQSIKHKKEHRKPYRRAKAISFSCRNHGTCDYCKNNRLFSAKKKVIAYENDLKEYLQKI